jgi:uncharacterized protein (DUF488 family)
MTPAERQNRLLAFLGALGGRIGALDFQKLLFLFCQEQSTATYEFVPYSFGGFSFTSYADKRRLIERGFLVNDEHAWALTSEGRAASSPVFFERASLDQFATRYRMLRGDDLVREAYRRYPYYAIRSEIAGRLFRRDLVALAAIDAARPSRGIPGVCTIGYEGRSLEGYLNSLIHAGVSLLCDVRRNPLSRKYGFAKNTLAKSCGGTGIRYEHLPELGIPSEDRKHLETQSDYDALFADYKRESLPGRTESLNRIHRWVQEGERVALTCYEMDPRQCHRHCVAEALHQSFGPALEPTHL